MALTVASYSMPNIDYDGEDNSEGLYGPLDDMDEDELGDIIVDSDAELDEEFDYDEEFEYDEEEEYDAEEEAEEADAGPVRASSMLSGYGASGAYPSSAVRPRGQSQQPQQHRLSVQRRSAPPAPSDASSLHHPAPPAHDRRTAQAPRGRRLVQGNGPAWQSRDPHPPQQREAPGAEEMFDDFDVDADSVSHSSSSSSDEEEMGYSQLPPVRAGQQAAAASHRRGAAPGRRPAGTNPRARSVPHAGARRAPSSSAAREPELHLEELDYEDEEDDAMEVDDTRSQTSRRSTTSASVSLLKHKKSNIVPYSGGMGLAVPMGVNEDMTDARRQGGSHSGRRQVPPAKGYYERLSVGGFDDDEDDGNMGPNGAPQDSEYWYKAVPRGLHQPYATRGHEETRKEREKRLERQWKEKMKKEKLERKLSGKK